MIRDAEAHSQEDRRRREEVEARNQADTVAYQVERRLQELGDRAPLHEKARAEQLITEVRDLLRQESSDVARLRQLTSDLQQIGYSLAAAGTGQEAGVRSQAGAGTDDDVIDAEYRPGR
jgi:molecular chaperone DnaK